MGDPLGMFGGSPQVPPWAVPFGLHPPFPGGTFDLYLDPRSSYYRADVAAHLRSKQEARAQFDADAQTQARARESAAAERERQLAEANRRAAAETLRQLRDHAAKLSLSELGNCWRHYYVPATHAAWRLSEINRQVSFRQDRYLHKVPRAGTVARCLWAESGETIDVYIDGYQGLCVAAPSDRLDAQQREVIVPEGQTPSAVALRRRPLGGHRGWRITSANTFRYRKAIRECDRNAAAIQFAGRPSADARPENFCWLSADSWARAFRIALQDVREESSTARPSRFG